MVDGRGFGEPRPSPKHGGFGHQAIDSFVQVSTHKVILIGTEFALFTTGDTSSDDDDPDFNVDDEYESVEDDGSDEQHIPNYSDVDTDVEGEFDSLVVRNVTNLPVGGVPSG
ncbi:hypothetical protein RJT34_24943 [Clitoria ternatea]|uniref:Uncharacterized protein n=1 Tax=Clitoria ternatea TaxID=43366 RepID=A0AAN9FP00_CLITE